MTNTITLPNEEALQETTAQDLKDSAEAAEFVESIMVTSDSQLKSATKVLAEIKTKFNEIELKRQNILTPLVEAQKELNKFFKPAQSALKKAEKEIKKKVADCIVERLGTRDALLDDLAAAPEDKRDDLLARADELVPPDIDGLTVYDQWSGDLTSNSLAVQWAIDNGRQDLLSIDTASLLAMTKAKDGDVDIDGWNPVKKSVVKITVGKVK